MPNFYVRAGEFRGYLFAENSIRERNMRSGTELAREIQLSDRSTAGEQGKLVFVIKPSLAQFISLFTKEKSSFDRPNYTSTQVFHFKISVKKKSRKEIPLDKQIVFVTSIQFVACALRENLSNRSSYRVIFVLVLGVICTLRSAVG